MVLEEETKIVQSRNAYTQYIVIPAAMVRDSQYPFEKNEKVKIIVIPEEEKIVIMKSGVTAVRPKRPEKAPIKPIKPSS